MWSYLIQYFCTSRIYVWPIKPQLLTQALPALSVLFYLWILVTCVSCNKCMRTVR